jgi:hypothetical protein
MEISSEWGTYGLGGGGADLLPAKPHLTAAAKAPEPDDFEPVPHRRVRIFHRWHRFTRWSPPMAVKVVGLFNVTTELYQRRECRHCGLVQERRILL